MRWISLLTLALAGLLLAGCDNTRSPVEYCDARETVSGTCTHTHFECPVPMKLYSEWGGPICATRNPKLPDDGALKEIEK